MGIDDLRGFNFAQGGPIDCFATEETFEHIKRVFYYIFTDNTGYKGGGLPKLNLHPIEFFTPFEVNDEVITPFPLEHGHITVTGYRTGDLIYATDFKEAPRASKEIMRGAKVAIIDGLRYEPHQTHQTIDEAIALAEELGFKETWLTHMTHTIDYAVVEPQLPQGVHLAYDGLKVAL